MVDQNNGGRYSSYGVGRGGGNGIISSASVSRQGDSAAPSVPTRDYEFDARIKVTLPEDAEGQSMLQLFLLSQGKVEFPITIEDVDARTNLGADGTLTLSGPVMVTRVNKG